jgi:hypothetical protein
MKQKNVIGVVAWANHCIASLIKGSPQQQQQQQQQQQ